MNPVAKPRLFIKHRGCHLFLWSALLLLPFDIFAAQSFRPGEVWLDTSNQPVQAHGGGILLHDHVYYWYGEDRTPGGHGMVACYSSTNLYDWRREGVALSRADLPRDGEHYFVERPKVIFNPRTKKFVMWMHLEKNGNYYYARAGIATSDTPAGPFKFLKAIRPVADTNSFAVPDAEKQNLYGGTLRDMNLFVDDDGQAYVFYSSAGNWTMYIARLNEDFTGPELPVVENKTWAKALVRQMREGAAPFKWNGKYYLITSACTGWAPNAANYSVATNILGPWQTFGNPCTGENSEKTFGAQSTYVLPLPGNPDGFIFMADRWNPKNLPDSRYIWLPFTMNADGTFTIPWRDRWSYSDFQTHSPLAETKAASVELFNGKDFSGWTFFERGNTDPAKTWSVSDGLIHCTGKPHGYLRTEKKYGDFKFTVEWRFPSTMTNNINTGVCVFMEDRAADAPANSVWPNCIECQGMHNHQGDFWLQGGATCAEPVTQGRNGIKMPKPSAENAPGEWNTYEVICKSNTVEIVVNGQSMNKITGCNNSSGYIGLQSEGGPWEARKVTLEPLP